MPLDFVLEIITGKRHVLSLLDLTRTLTRSSSGRDNGNVKRRLLLECLSQEVHPKQLGFARFTTLQNGRGLRERATRFRSLVSRDLAPVAGS